MMGDDRRSGGRRAGLSPGTQLNGVYEIEDLIAVGGMGEVYKGRAIQTGDAVAIKTIRPDLAQNQAAMSLFRKEAAALHNLYHEALVRYYVFSVDPQIGSPYLAMEYVDGEPLSDVLKRGALGYEAVRVLQRRLADGLQAAHELGIVHRDISPDNVILPAGQVGRAKIIDFAIARSTLLGDVTVIGGGVAGKFGYMSPEQLGLYGGTVTPRSDIYSLGLVLAEVLGGRALDMQGTQANVIEKRRRVPDLSGLDSRMRPLLESMLQPNPTDRIASMADVAAWQPRNVALGPSRLRGPIIAAGLVGSAAIAAVVFVVFVAPRLTTETRPARVDEIGTGPAIGPPTGVAGGSVTGAETGADSRTGSGTIPGSGPPATGAGTSARVEAPPPLPPQPSDPRRYVREYEGGDCFFIHPLNISSASASIEGFGSSPSAFEAFETAFKTTFGFEPEINLRPITDAQCPAVNFMKMIGVDLGRGPKLQIDAFNLKLGETQSGSVESFGGRHVEVLLVADDGYVHNLSDYLKREGASARFRLRPERPAGARRSRPQLVFALASPQRLALLSTGKPLAGDTLFPLLLDEVRTGGAGVDLAVKYFRIE
jgi:eukaryotic-like serine/threonine-protein kinase